MLPAHCVLLLLLLCVAASAVAATADTPRGLRGVRTGLGSPSPFSLVSLSSSDLPVESHQLSVSIYFIHTASGSNIME